MQNSPLRLLFLGDSGVGKTSIICTLASGTFPREVEKTVHSISINHDSNFEPSIQPTYILDSSTNPEDEVITDTEIIKATAILLVYDISLPQNIDRLENYWLPRISKVNNKPPIILVGNKLDLKPAESIEIQNEELADLVEHLSSEFPQVEMGINCSCKQYFNIVESIYAAQRAILFPMFPLFDSKIGDLKLEYKRALERIFRIYDTDFNNYITDLELEKFQAQVFQKNLSSREISSLKEVLIDECQEKYTRFDSSKGINLTAFIEMNKIMLIKRKVQSCWQILRFFRYNESLLINEEYFTKNFEKIIITDKSRLSLSKSVISFLKNIFIQYSNQNVIGNNELYKIFYPYSKGNPFNISKIIETKEGNLNIDKWIALWQMLFSLQFKEAFIALTYIGCCLSFKECVIVDDHKIFSQNRHTNYRCCLFGSPKSGKTSLIDCLLGNNLKSNVATTNSENTAVFENRMIGKESFNLLITEYPQIEIESVVSNKIEQFDSILLLYKDTKESIEYLFNLLSKIPYHFPIYLIQMVHEKSASIIKNMYEKSSEININSEKNIKSLEEIGFQIQASRNLKLNLSNNVIPVNITMEITSISNYPSKSMSLEKLNLIKNKMKEETEYLSTTTKILGAGLTIGILVFVILRKTHFLGNS